MLVVHKFTLFSYEPPSFHMNQIQQAIMDSAVVVKNHNRRRWVRIDIQQAKLSFHNYECVITLVMHNATE